MSSRLFQNIREKRGLAYAVFSGLTAYRDAGMLTVYAGCAAENVGEVIDLVVEEMRGMKREAITGAELRRSSDREKDLEQSHICLGTPAFPQSHDERFASYVLNTVFGGSMSSRLFQNIREKRGLAYAVFSGLTAYRDAGMLHGLRRLRRRERRPGRSISSSRRCAR